MKMILAAAALVTITGACSKDEVHDYYAQVSSDTSWSGAFDNRTVDGSGSQKVDLADEDIVCVVVQKDTEQGRLKVEMWDHVTQEDGFLAPGKDEERKLQSATTHAAYGVVSVCNQ